MLLAELEVWHSRPFTPTRRVALGHLVLPVDPAPGFGGLLLGAVVAAHLGGVDDDLVPDVHRLISQIEHGQRGSSSPRLRHRFQVDRHGLAPARHRLLGSVTARTRRFELRRPAASPCSRCSARSTPSSGWPRARHARRPVLHKAMRWRGPIGPALIAHLAGGSPGASLAALADPLAWALEVLGFPVGTAAAPSARSRHGSARCCATCTPTTAATSDGAGIAIGDLTEARRILLS